MKKIILGLLIVVGFGLNGCTSLFSSECLKNVNSYSDARRAIKNGMTMSQVEKKWGRPNSKSSYNGRATWTYSEAKSSEQTFKNALYQGMTGRSSMDVKVVQIVFNSRNRVQKVRYIEQTQ